MNVVFFFICLIILYIKPYLFFVSFFVFCFEFQYFLYYFQLYYYYKKDYSYNCISVDKYDYNMTTLSLWLAYNKIKAFNRIYIYVCYTKPSLYHLIKIFFIILFDIPVRLFSLIRILLFYQGDITERIRIMYDSEYEKSENLKIEFLQHEIYLNCRNINSLVQIFKNKGVSRGQCYNIIQQLTYHNNEFNTFENNEKSRLLFYMSSLETHEGFKIPFIHPAYRWNLEIKHPYPKSFILHATSNCDVELKPSQIRTSSISDLIKKDAINPGSIISFNAKCEEIKPFKSIRKVHIESTLFTIKDEIAQKFSIDIDLTYSKYLEEKKNIYIEIFEKNNVEIDNNLINELTSNLWSLPSDNDLLIDILGDAYEE